jgi:hypothetical protein
VLISPNIDPILLLEDFEQELGGRWLVAIVDVWGQMVISVTKVAS